VAGKALFHEMVSETLRVSKVLSIFRLALRVSAGRFVDERLGWPAELSHTRWLLKPLGSFSIFKHALSHLSGDKQVGLGRGICRTG
jgi:hypothetical protein